MLVVVNSPNYYHPFSTLTLLEHPMYLSNDFQTLSLRAKGHVQEEISKWIDLLAPLTLSSIPSPPSTESFQLSEVSRILLLWTSPGITFRDDKDLTLFSTLMDNLPHQERRNLIVHFSNSRLDITLKIERNHLGDRVPESSSTEEYPIIQALGWITIRLPKEFEEFQTVVRRIQSLN
jgi:hypothetical protein